MSLHTSPHARVRADRAGDPLDGLVNLFDLGIVLSVAFLLAALSSLKLTGALIHHARSRPPSAAGAITTGPHQATRPLHLKPGERLVGRGSRVGSVYRLRDGRLIYVVPRGARP